MFRRKNKSNGESTSTVEEMESKEKSPLSGNEESQKLGERESPGEDGGKKKSLKKTLAKIVVAVAAVAILAYAYMGRNVSGKEAAYNKYDNNHKEMTYSLLDYHDVFGTWNWQDLGNDVNVLLSGGKVYDREGLSVLPDKDGGYSIYDNGKEIGRIDREISFINVTNNMIYFRSDINRDIYSRQIDKNSDKRILEGNFGELFLSDERLYTIDLNNGELISVNLAGNDKRVEYASPINSFVVCGKDAIILDNNFCLGIHNLEEGQADQFEQIICDVERFFINGNIVIETGSTVSEIDISDDEGEEGEGRRVVYQTGDTSSRLIGISGRSILVQEGGRLYSLLNNERTTLVKSEYKLYESALISADGKTQYVIAVAKKENAPDSIELLALKR